MNCRRRREAKTERASVERKEGKPRKGNGVFEGGDKHGMEYRPVEKRPEWEGKGRKVEWK